MRPGGGFIGAATLGVALGVVSSLTNASPVPAARFAGYVVNAGWAWAGVALAAGWLLRSHGRAAMAGVLALFTTTTAYYVLDSVLRRESLASYWYEMRVWWIASVVLGSALGVVGACARRPGVTGLLACLVVPVGAAVEMAWLPRWGTSLDPDPVLQGVRVAVWTSAALSVAVLARRPFVSGFRRVVGRPAEDVSGHP